MKKIGFSFLLTILMLSIFTNSAFAAAFTANLISVTPTATPHEYDVVWEAPTDTTGLQSYRVLVNGTERANVDNSTLTARVTLTGSAAIGGPTTFQVRTMYSTAANNRLSNLITLNVSPNWPNTNDVDLSDGSTVGALNTNANSTGTGVDNNTHDVNVGRATVIKNVEGHQTHGDYQSNTNSCASCHQTHTAKSDSKLLFANSIFQACASCHDGTLGFYNVFETGANASIDGAGTFGGNTAHNMSAHMANNSLAIKAAPGGNPNGVTVAGGSQWGASFSCASCHTPHGSYSDRLLHYNPNGFATTPQVTAGANTFGNYLQNLPIVGTKQAGNHLLRTTEDGRVKIELHNGTAATSKVVGPWMYGYTGNGATAVHFTRLHNGTDTVNANRVYYNSSANIKVNLAEGYIKALNEAGDAELIAMTAGHISRPYIVKMNLEIDTNKTVQGGPTIYKTNQAAYWDGFNVATTQQITGWNPDKSPIVENTKNRRTEFINAGYTVNGSNEASGLGVRVSTYCATCHTDYFTARSNSGGSYWTDGGANTAAYRHSTNSDRFACVRCHFAHGTEAEIMMDAAGNTVASLTAAGGGTPAAKDAALETMMDKNHSSALKKFTNMSSCYACHSNSSRATSFKNNDKRGAADAQNPAGMPIVNGIQR